MAVAAVLHPPEAFDQSPILNSRRRYSSKRQKGSPVEKDATPINPKPRFTTTTSSSINANKLVMGQVKILKRGDTLPLPSPVPGKFSRKVQNTVLVSRKLVESNIPAKAPLVCHKPVRKTPAKSRKYMMYYKKFQHTFAGSTFERSPEPSSLPLPAFYSKMKI